METDSEVETYSSEEFDEEFYQICTFLSSFHFKHTYQKMC